MLFPLVSHGLDSTKSGDRIVDASGNFLYWSVKQKKYISCFEFIGEGSYLYSPLGLEGIQPSCKAIDTSKLKGTIKLSDGKNVKATSNKPKDVKGKKLFCSFKNNDPISDFGIEFKSKNRAKLLAIDDEEEKILSIIGKYKALSDRIKIEYKRPDGEDMDMIIDRKNLKLMYSSNSFCEVLKRNDSIEKKLQFALNELITKKSAENKF